MLFILILSCIVEGATFFQDATGTKLFYTKPSLLSNENELNTATLFTAEYIGQVQNVAVVSRFDSLRVRKKASAAERIAALRFFFGPVAFCKPQSLYPDYDFPMPPYTAVKGSRGVHFYFYKYVDVDFYSKLYVNFADYLKSENRHMLENFGKPSLFVIGKAGSLLSREDYAGMRERLALVKPICFKAIEFRNNWLNVYRHALPYRPSRQKPNYQLRLPTIWPLHPSAFISHPLWTFKRVLEFIAASKTPTAAFIGGAQDYLVKGMRDVYCHHFRIHDKNILAGGVLNREFESLGLQAPLTPIYCCHDGTCILNSVSDDSYRVSLIKYNFDDHNRLRNLKSILNVTIPMYLDDLSGTDADREKRAILKLRNPVAS